MRTRVALAALLCGAAVLGACGSTEGGTPAAVPGAAGSPPGSTPPGPSPGPSPGALDRPADITLDGKDACLLSPEQAAALGVSSEPRRDTMRGGTVVDGAPICTYLVSAQQSGFSFLTTADVGVDEYLASSHDVPTAEVEVDGFRAVEQEGVTSRPQTGSGECYVLVDVADGEMLSVQFSQIAASEDKRLPIETLCARARDVASAAVSTLQGG